jgi:hypothetical protein
VWTLEDTQTGREIHRQSSIQRFLFEKLKTIKLILYKKDLLFNIEE